MLYSLSIDEGHCTAKLIIEEPQSFAFLDVRVESSPVGTVHLFGFSSTLLSTFLLQDYHLVALGGVPVVHLLDPVEGLDGGEFVGIALSCVHRVHRQVLFQRRVLLEEECKVREWRGFLGQLCSVEEGFVVPFDGKVFYSSLSKGFEFESLGKILLCGFLTPTSAPAHFWSTRVCSQTHKLTNPRRSA